MTTKTLTASLVASDLVSKAMWDIRTATDRKARTAAARQLRKARQAERDAQIAEGLAEWRGDHDLIIDPMEVLA